QRDVAIGPFRGAVVNLQLAVFEKARQRISLLIETDIAGTRGEFLSALVHIRDGNVLADDFEFYIVHPDSTFSMQQDTEGNGNRLVVYVQNHRIPRPVLRSLDGSLLHVIEGSHGSIL